MNSCNFPIISKPILDKDYDLSECLFDLKNKDQDIIFLDIVNEYDQWCKMEINYM